MILGSITRACYPAPLYVEKVRYLDVPGVASLVRAESK